MVTVWVGRGPTTGPLVFSAPFSVRLGNKRPPGHQLNQPTVLFDPPCGPRGPMGSYQVALGTPIGLDARFHFSPNPPERYSTSLQRQQSTAPPLSGAVGVWLCC